MPESVLRASLLTVNARRTFAFFGFFFVPPLVGVTEALGVMTGSATCAIAVEVIASGARMASPVMASLFKGDSSSGGDGTTALEPSLAGEVAAGSGGI